MSDSDDWEKFAEQDDEGLDKILKSGKFGDEQTKVEEVKAPPPSEDKKAQAKPKSKPVKEKSKPQDSVEKPSQESIAEGKRKAEIADNEITDDLFGVKPVTELKSEDNYIEYAREVNRRLAKGLAHFRLPKFFAEIFKDTSKLMKVEEINEIIKQLNIIQNERVKSEKQVKKVNKKPALKVDKDRINFDDEGDEHNEYEDFL
jgi:hypothetical protein